MPGEDGYFDERVAARYDESSAAMFDPAVLEPAVDFLADLAGDGARARARDRHRPGRAAARAARRAGARHRALAGDGRAAARQARRRGRRRDDRRLRDHARGGHVPLAYLVFNTIMNLTTQDAQVACFANAAAHLEPGGCFVIEVGIPDLQRLPPGETVVPFDVSPTHCRLRRVRRRRAGPHRRTTSRSSTGAPSASRCPSATSGRPSWT